MSKTSERSHRYSAERKSKSSTPPKELIPGEENNKEKIENDSQSQVKVDELAEERQKAEENARKLEEEKKMALEAQVATEQRICNRLEMREKNLDATTKRPDESFLKSLDSSMKKNTAFVKKLRTVNEQQRDSLVNEFKGLNLTKFIQEAVTALAEAKLKVADVGVAACICSLFHQRYADFTVLFKKTYTKIFETIDCKEDQKAAMATKFRPAVRLLGELVLDGFYTSLTDGLQLLGNILQTIVNADKGSHVYAPVMLTVVRHCGEDLAGLIPRKQRRWREVAGVEFPTLGVLTSEQRHAFLTLFREYFANMSSHLVNTHKDLQKRERQNRQTIGLKGELPLDRKESFEKAQKIYDKLLTSTTSLAELLDEDMPELPEEPLEEREDFGSINIFTPIRGAEYDSETGLWEDDDTRTFYEDIKDMKIFLPQIVFKEQDVPSNAQRKEKLMKEKRKKKERKLRVDLNMIEDSLEYTDDFTDPDDTYEQDVLGDEADDDDAATVGMAAVAEAYFTKLPTCVNRDFIDQAAEDFLLKLNTKGNKKKLVKALFNVNRTRLDLLPFYARLVATLAPCLVDIAPDLVWLLKGSFLSHLRKKDQIHMESKIKTVRFIGELTKFKVCPKAETLHCLKMLLDKFTHHNIDMACNLLETCGRFLYRSPESNPRMAALLEQMMRKKTVQTFDIRHTTLIENAFYYCNPPERQKVQRKVRPVIHEYIRKLLYKDLSKTTTEKVLRQIRKLPWNDVTVAGYVGKCLTRVWNIKFNNVRCAANMLSGLAEYHEDIAISVIDGILESIRLGMETNFFRDNQRRVSCMKYLGEMYNYQLVDSQIIFSTLYLLLTFGSCIDMNLSEMDPPEHLFRIRLCCTLLDTCGQYFDRGSSKKKLDCFLVFFQCYIWQKKESGYWNEQCPFPREVEYMVNDTFEVLRPSLKIATSFEEAKQAAEALNKEYENKIREISTTVESDPSSAPESAKESPHLNSPYNKSSPMAFSPVITSQSSQEDEPEIYEGECFEDEEYSQPNDEEPIFAMEDEVHMLEAPKFQQCEEDDIFCKQFERMLGDSITDRLHDNMVTPNLDIAIPLNLRGKQKKQHNNSSSVEECNTPPAVNFVMMIKRNNKQVLKDLPIPITSDLAATIHDKQKAERAEREEMKRLVLDYNQRQEEESYNARLELMSHVRPARSRGSRQHTNKPTKGGAPPSRLRSRDTEQQLFNTSNRSPEPFNQVSYSQSKFRSAATRSIPPYVTLVTKL